MERKHQYLPTLLDRLQDDEPKEGANKFLI